MPKNIVVTVYTLPELKETHPLVFKRLHKKFAESVDEVPWSRETVDSLFKCVAALGAKVKTYSLGPYDRCVLRVEFTAEPREGETLQDYALRRLKVRGYVFGDANDPTFNGHCGVTGYCADDTFLEAFWNHLKSTGDYVGALESLAHVAGVLLREDLEQAQNEESFLYRYEESVFTADGVELGYELK
jgi:hypothetical protein